MGSPFRITAVRMTEVSSKMAIIFSQLFFVLLIVQRKTGKAWLRVLFQWMPKM